MRANKYSFQETSTMYQENTTNKDMKLSRETEQNKNYNKRYLVC